MSNKMESVPCIGCKQMFERRAIKGNRRQVCDRECCARLKRLMSWNPRPVSFSKFHAGAPTKYTADLDYHGRPNP